MHKYVSYNLPANQGAVVAKLWFHEDIMWVVVKIRVPFWVP